MYAGITYAACGKSKEKGLVAKGSYASQKHNGF